MSEPEKTARRALVDDISRLLAERLQDKARVEVLEAGCGSGSHLAFPERSHLTGIDISAKQLVRNHRIHKRILGDLQTYPYQPASFDIIICWDVLEHLSDPGAALDGFVRALRSNGYLILGFPKRDSLKGWLTRALPQVAHVWFYRWVLGNPEAGREDKGPFPTPMRRAMDDRAVIERMTRAGVEVLTAQSYESTMMRNIRKKFGLVGLRWHYAQRLLHIVTRGRIDVTNTDCLLVLRRSPARSGDELHRPAPL